jgi:hypothetical protein
MLWNGNECGGKGGGELMRISRQPFPVKRPRRTRECGMF